MFRIKRTKTAGAGDDLHSAVHYAAAVSPHGTIDRWTSALDQAVPITDTVAERVKEYYRGRANVGRLEFEPVTVSAQELAEAVAAEDGVQATEFRTLQDAYRELESSLAESRRIAQEAKAAADSSQRKEAQAVQRTLDLEQTLIKRGQEISVLQRRIEELEKPKAPAEKDDTKRVLPKSGSSTAPPKGGTGTERAKLEPAGTH